MGRSSSSAPPCERRFAFDRESVRAVDRAASETYGIPGLILMENAARSLRDVALAMLKTPAARVAVVCGGGNNGGDGWALARHLHNAGHRPVVVELAEPRAGTDAACNRAIARAMSIETVSACDGLQADLVVDAIFGTGLTRVVEGAAAAAIDWINQQMAPVLAVDLPSGLDCDRGEPLGVAVRATRTVTFVGLKQGFLVPNAAAFTGEVTIGDIGAPRALIERFGTPLN